MTKRFRQDSPIWLFPLKGSGEMSSAASDKTAGGGGKGPADAGQQDIADFREFILTRELSEVFLLLDNLAADADTTIAALSKQKPPDGLKGDWIEQICQIRWPSTDSRATQAEQAALVIKAKDYLNGLAKPASGSSVAFTVLFTQRPKDETKRKRKSDGKGDDAVDKAGSRPALKDCRTARRAMAAEAYPEYEEAAGRFRRFHRSICVVLFVWLVLTCLLSWYVAYGNAALGEVATFKTNLEKAQARVDDDEAGHRTAVASTAGADTLTPSQAPAPAPAMRERRSADTSVVKTDPQVSYCERWKLIPQPTPPDGLVRYENPEQRQACRDLATAQADLRHGEYRLYKWLGLWRPVLNVSPPWRDSEDASSVASRLTSVLGSAVLPVLYGVSRGRRRRAALDLAPHQIQHADAARSSPLDPAACARRGCRRLHRPLHRPARREFASDRTCDAFGVGHFLRRRLRRRRGISGTRRFDLAALQRRRRGRDGTAEQRQEPLTVRPWRGTA
jgi:hypothetical protein